MISILAALNGSILSGSRVPYAMARDGRFFRGVAHVHPVHHTPSVSILLLSAWAALLVLSGRYDQLYTYVIFASSILYGMATASVIGAAAEAAGSGASVPDIGLSGGAGGLCSGDFLPGGSTLIKSPRESLMGLGLIALGLPFYYYWNGRRTRETL